MDRKEPPSTFRMSLHGLPYSHTVQDTPPIPILTRSSEPTPEQIKAHGVVPVSISVGAKSNLRRETDSRPNSGRTRSSVGESGTTVDTEDQSHRSSRSRLSVPQIRIESEAVSIPPSRKGEKSWLGAKPAKPTAAAASAPGDDSFHGIALDIPVGGFVDDLEPEKMEFSKRGSMLIQGAPGGKTDETLANNNLQPGLNGRRVKSSPSLRKSIAPRLLSVEEELLSVRVRSFYESGMESGNELNQNLSVTRSRPTVSQPTSASLQGSSRHTSAASDVHSDQSTTDTPADQHREWKFKKEELELAGGLEDWQDVESGDVDRYGFIMPKSSTIRSVNGSGLRRSVSSREPPTLQRVSTSLQLAADAPRRRHTIRRSPSNAKSIKSSGPPNGLKILSLADVTRPISSQSSYQGGLSGANSRLRQAANKFPHNRDRRIRDEAGDMLTLPFRLAEVSETGQSDARESYLRRKEMERDEKWRKMARVVSKATTDGGGMRFDFDTQSPKLIERTWKGIPDRWRATAWHAFLSASAKKREKQLGKECLSDEELIEQFHEHQSEASPDDVQIDIDVPRTISSHIMFRRRYRGGQRLLFRVLHAMSLHFPSTGYVQGMAALAATLLAYYDEENAFVMLVRLWELRGLDRLYESGFDGLMEALDDFQKRWLDGGEISAKLTKLGVPPTSYGTRWYLTLFNYSIPFPAQLRVWDVFMLLGDSDDGVSGPSTTPACSSFGTSLDVLHATSAALIDGTRQILLDSDFENAMKVLTSWIPIQDEDLFMRVAKAEWKMHRNGCRKV